MNMVAQQIVLPKFSNTVLQKRRKSDEQAISFFAHTGAGALGSRHYHNFKGWYGVPTER